VWLKEAVVSYLDGREEYFKLEKKLEQLPKGKGKTAFNRQRPFESIHCRLLIGPESAHSVDANWTCTKTGGGGHRSAMVKRLPSF
jgi:hypothetical protein